ncbi:hypothetical protein BRD00_15110 [Halobacteriales archaeon QS_8_69_26]|nr:MAG: hypothetical protein BRD00_15110 [Halobacteriales archaeon QS_8_69_26]
MSDEHRADDPEPVAATVRDYYEALRRGEPLYPYFEESPATAKVGIGETLLGYGATAEALREQTRVTRDWTVESHRLRAGRRGETGWFSDLVGMAWTHEDDPLSFDTRWTGALVDRGEEWVFVELHVSVAHDPETGAPAGFGTNLDGTDTDDSGTDADDSGAGSP